MIASPKRPPKRLKKCCFLVISLLCAGFIEGGGVPARAADPETNGRKLAEKYCARCHVVGDFNRHGGIGSTPSFQLLANAFKDWRNRFLTFYARRPHPAYVRVKGVARWTESPATTTEIFLTLDDVEDITAFAKTLKKD